MGKNNNAKIEIFLVVLISICMLALINVSTSKMNEVLLSNNSIILRDNPDKMIDSLLANEISKYKLDPCTMMEVYDSDFNMIISVPFETDDNHQKHAPVNLKAYDTLRELYNKYPEGHTRLVIGEYEEDIYFRWTETNDSKKRLAVIHISRPIVKNIWMIPFLCYLILILIFILVVRLRVSCQKDRINYYQKTSTRVQNLIK